MDPQPISTASEWLRKNILPDPKIKPPTYTQLTRDTKDHLLAPLHARLSHYNSIPPRAMDVSSKEYNELLKQHSEESIEAVSKKTQLNSYPAYSADLAGTNIYTQPFANICNTDTDNNILTRFQLDPRFSNLKCAGTKYMSVDGEHVNPPKVDIRSFDTLYDEQYTVTDALSRPFQSISTAAKASLDYLDTTKTPSFAQATLGVDITDGAHAALTVANKGHHLLHIRTNLQGATPSCDISLESDAFTNNCVVSLRGYGCDSSGADLTAAGLDVTAAGYTASACVQSRPAFLPMINRNYRARLADISGNVNVIGAGSGGFGGGIVGSGGSSNKLSSHRRSGRGSTHNMPPMSGSGAGAAGRLVSVMPARGGISINESMLSGVDVLAAGLGSERDEHICADFSAPLALDYSPLVLNEKERALLDCPVVHLSLSRPVTPVFDAKNPYTHAFLGARYSYSLYYPRWLQAIAAERQERATAVVSVLGHGAGSLTDALQGTDPADDPRHDLYLSPAARHALRSVSIGYSQFCRQYSVAAELLDGGKHLRVMGAKHYFPPPTPTPVHVEEGLGSKMLRFLGGEEKVEEHTTTVYPHFSVAASLTSSLERLCQEHKAQYHRSHYLAARIKAEKRRAETAEYLQSVNQTTGKAAAAGGVSASGHAGRGESPLALNYTHSPIPDARTFTPTAASPNSVSPASPSSLQAPYIPLASLPPPPSRSLTDITTYTSFLRAMGSALSETHHVTVTASAHLNPQAEGAVTLDSRGNVRLAARLRNGEREAPFRRNALTAPNAAEDISRYASSFAALPAVDMPVSLEIAVQGSIRNPSLYNTGVSVCLQVGDV